MERQHVVAQAQQPVHQVLQHGRTAIGLQALAVDDAHAAVLVGVRLQQELAQHRLGLRGSGAMQVQFVLHRVLPALQALEQAWRQIVSPIAGNVAGFEGSVVAQQPGELTGGFCVVSLGHARARLGARRGRRGLHFLAQRRHFADGCTEQGSRIFVFRVRHAHRLNRLRGSAYDRLMPAVTADRVGPSARLRHNSRRTCGAASSLEETGRLRPRCKVTGSNSWKIKRLNRRCASWSAMMTVSTRRASGCWHPYCARPGTK
ncbi:hypothetical protein D3C72_1579690 [compost metagenome]